MRASLAWHLEPLIWHVESQGTKLYIRVRYVVQQQSSLNSNTAWMAVAKLHLHLCLDDVGRFAITAVWVSGLVC